ncbi:MAG: hypothetical protein OES79_06270 [Planctomycetota bacterium]|nr:hypothetical protein [Planctomycetota bacterium]
MAIETRCNGCGTIVTIADQHAGRRARCPHCQTEYAIPEASDLAALDAVCHFCGAVVPRTGTASEKDEFQTCDECRASIHENQAEIEDQHLRSAASRRAFVRYCWFVLGLVVLYGLLTVVVEQMWRF